jgi:hypothetical protein
MLVANWDRWKSDGCDEERLFLSRQVCYGDFGRDGAGPLSLQSLSCLSSTRQGNPLSLSLVSLPLSLTSISSLFGRLVGGLVCGSVGGFDWGVVGVLVERLVGGLVGVFIVSQPSRLETNKVV